MNIPGVNVFARFGYALHASNDDPALFLLYEQWQDQAGLDRHMKQPYFAEMQRKLDGALETPMEVIVGRMIGG